MTDELDQLATALAAFQAEMPIVSKTKTATVRSEKGSYSYTYAGLADVTEAAMPLLTKHGLSFVCLPAQGQLTGMLLHSSGQSLSAALPINGSTPQQVGSSLTYMRRYLLGCMTGLVTDDDDDGHAASTPPRQSKQSQAPVNVAAAPTEAHGPGAAAATRRVTEPAITAAQVKKVAVQMGELGLTDRQTALVTVAEIIGHEVSSRNELTRREAGLVITHLGNLLGELPEPQEQT